ncbi:MAG: hypothetical protein ACPH8C_00830 [Candidatus Puniceispirillaceae bacterium]
MTDLIWLHEGALRRTHPVFAMADKGASALFIWDRARFDAAHIGARRQLFIYETLVELDLDIFEGDAAQLLPRLVAAQGASRLLVPASPDPAIMKQLAGISQALPGLAVEIIADTSFVTLAKEPDLGRFFRYWNKARKSALRLHGV